MKTPVDKSHPVSLHHYVVTAKRYSSDSQDPISNEIQQRIITEFLHQHAPAAKVLMTWEDVDSAWTGTRRQLIEIFDTVKRHNRRSSKRVTLLLLMNWNRFFRNMKEANRWIGKFEEIGVMVNTVERWFDPENPEEQIMRAFELYQAQKYSDALSDNIRRGHDEKLTRGIYCHRLPTLFLRRDYYDVRRYTIERVEPAFSACQGAGRQVIAGVPYAKAHRLAGGRAVLGPLSTWWELLGKPLAKGEYKGQRMDMPALFTPSEWDQIQAIRQGNSARIDTTSTKDVDYEHYVTHGCLRCCKCGGLLTTSRPRSRNGSFHHYQVCHHHNPRHYRIRAGAVTAAAYDMISELSLSANAQAAVLAETKRLAATDRRAAEKNLRGLRKELDALTKGYETATLKNAMGQFSDAQLQVVEKHYRAKAAAVAQAETVVEHCDEILRVALASLNDIGTLVKGQQDPAQTNSFLAMLFPDGLFFDRDSSIFRTTSMNAAFTRTGWGSMDYSRIKIGGAPFMDAPPETWRIPESNR